MLDLIIHRCNFSHNNTFFMLREDLIPFSFGGNKVRKAIKFFEHILDNKYDTVITYGSASSNNCRVIANMAKMHNLKCIVITPKENNNSTINSELVRYLNAKIVFSDVKEIKKPLMKQ